MKYLDQFSEKQPKLFLWLFWNCLFAFLPIWLFLAILSLVGLVPVTINDEPTYGFLGFVFCIIFIPLSAIALSVNCWVFIKVGNFFLRLFSRFI